MPAQHIPAQFRGAVPYLYIKGAAEAIEFYKSCFGAAEIMRMTDPKTGAIGHAEIKIGDAAIMLADEFPSMGVLSPKTIGGSPVTIMLYVDDVDTIVKQAVAGGAKILRPVEDQLYGDRAGKIEDPFGHTWFIATHKEEVSPEEIAKRAKAKYGMA